MNLEVTGSPSGPSRNVTVCASLAEPAEHLADRLGLPIRPRPPRPAMRAGLLGRHGEGGAFPEHLGRGTEREHVLAAGVVQAITQPGVLPIGVVTQHRCARDGPFCGVLDQLDPEL